MARVTAVPVAAVPVTAVPVAAEADVRERPAGVGDDEPDYYEDPGFTARSKGFGPGVQDEAITGGGWATAAAAVAGAGLADEEDPFTTADRRPVRVLLVDDDPMVLMGLTMMLGTFDEIEVVGTASDGVEVASAVNSVRPDVVLMDIRMPGMDGLTATESLRARRGAPEVIVLTTFDTDEHVLRAMRSGASGFLLKHTPPGEIVRAVCRVAAGEPMMSPTVLRRMIEFLAGMGVDPERDRARAILKELSPSEYGVAMQIAEGRTNQEIAGDLLMSIGTVKAYVTRIFTKLSVTNRTQIALLVHNAR